MSFALWELRIPALVQLLMVLGCTPSRCGEFGCGEQALGAEPLGVAGQLVLAACFDDDAGGERFALAGAVTGDVERLGGLGVGVGVEEPVERGEGVGAGLAGLPGLGWDRDGEAVWFVRRGSGRAGGCGRSCAG